ncbi:galactokinase [Chromatiales bacterium (ex Bugula neritina AB1)]|nr:galactokinase [Chromatiales bacterium (ex Bugula neritina AB1)]
MSPDTSKFIDAYGGTTDSILCFHAPGRVNLIGEYTDFNGGPVFPCAIDRGNTLYVRRTTDATIEFISEHFADRRSLQGAELEQKQGNDSWVNYPLGVINEFAKLGHSLHGLQLYYTGNVPSGAGLSSSASIEVLTAFALNQLFELGIAKVDLAVLAQRAENNFVGVQCGIMDQFAVAMAEEDYAIALQCDTLEYRQVPLKLGQYKIIISNTNQQRGLAEIAYNERVSECNTALAALEPATGAAQLASITPEQLAGNLHLLTDPVIRNRASHVISETNRVYQAVTALTVNDLKTFGQLMNDSHASLRDLFEVSSDPLDSLVKHANAIPGVAGSRMTGAGFGGCTVSLVHSDAVEKFKATVGKLYFEETGLHADFYETGAANGVQQLPL